jgi:hypothetical protein
VIEPDGSSASLLPCAQAGALLTKHRAGQAHARSVTMRLQRLADRDDGGFDNGFGLLTVERFVERNGGLYCGTAST